jgi:prepilin-type N-terminal cleavage/methylation domain-containing protein/prepilin-type processing-associated H-X9-DG protein
LILPGFLGVCAKKPGTLWEAIKFAQNAEDKMKLKGSRVSPSARGGSHQRRSAFTLIELLVVIGIIAILASLLLPVLARANVKAQGIQCVSNLKQLQLSWQIYAHDCDDRLPLNNNTVGISGNWVSTKDSWVVGNAQEDLTSTNIERGTLYPHNSSAALYHCPADKSSVTNHKNLLRTRSYALNWYLGVTSNVYPDPRIRHRFAAITNPGPSEVYSFIDEDERVIDDGIFFCPESLGEWGDVPAIRHAFKANLSFADGHAELHKWQTPSKLGDAAHHEDLRWLWEHSPR